MCKYNHITLSERVGIFEGLKLKLGIREIAVRIGRSASTVSREMRRNSDYIGYLYPQEGHYRAQQRKVKHPSKIDKLAHIKSFVVEKLHQHWSPIAIAGRWSKDYPDQSICPETIYRYIYAQKNKNLALWKLLPRKKKRRGIVRKSRSRETIQERVTIHERPELISKREVFGHFESDLFFNKGSQSANVLNSVERVSRKMFLIRSSSKKSEEIVSLLRKSIGGLASSITFDNGSEFAKHTDLKKNGIDTYFCDPGSPWQKGSVEHANGMIRRFLPFKVSYEEISQELLDRVVEIINNIPRKSLNFLTPNEVFNSFYQKSSTVALQN